MNKLIYFGLIIVLVFGSNFTAGSQELYSFNNRVDQLRFTKLISQIRCVVCQNQNIADSNAPLANDLRLKVYSMVNQHQSNEEIKNYLVKHYGEFVLLQPRFVIKNYLLWLFPLLALTIALVLMIRFTKQKVR